MRQSVFWLLHSFVAKEDDGHRMKMSSKSGVFLRTLPAFRQLISSEGKARTFSVPIQS